jgi:hypothetical protein
MRLMAVHPSMHLGHPPLELTRDLAADQEITAARRPSKIRYLIYSPFNDITSSIGLAGEDTNPYRS